MPSGQSQRTKRSKLTPEGWVYVVILSFISIGSILRNVNLLVVMTGMMVAPLILNWRLGTLRTRSLFLKRVTPIRIHAGQVVSMAWSCENKDRRMSAWNVMVHDEIRCLTNAFGEAEQETPSAIRRLMRSFGKWFKRSVLRQKFAAEKVARLRFMRIKPGASEMANYRCYFPRRGEYQSGPAEISVSAPFGLVTSRIIDPHVDSILVAPALGKLHPTWERRMASIATGDQSRNRRRGVEEDEFHALRQWRMGDNRKNIHWRSTAKLGTPMVKEFDQQNNRDFALLLDLHSFDEATFEQCEHLLSFAATAMLQIGADVQGQIAVAVCGRENELYYGRNPLEVSQRIMRSLATAVAVDKPKIAADIIELSQRVSRGTPIDCFSSRPAPEWLQFSDESLLAAWAGIPEAEAQRLMKVKENVRWVEIDSEEFRLLFTTHEEDLRPASELAAKWVKAESK